MHNAPPVVFPVGRFVWGRWIMGGLALTGMAGLLAASHFQGARFSMGALFAVAVLWLVLCAAAWRVARMEHWKTGALAWTGEVWLWRDPLHVAWEIKLKVVWDSGAAMGLMLTPQGSQRTLLRRFVWVSQSDLPVMWHGFRCAVYSPPFTGQKTVAAADDLV